MQFVDETLKMLADFQSWNEQKPGAARISIFDYLCFNATPDLLFGFASLFFCELVEIEGNYFIKERFGASAYGDWKKTTTDIRAIQRVMNHVHMRSLFQQQQMTDSLALACANLIAEAWNRVFKEKSLVAEVHGQTFEEISVTLVAAE